MKSVIKNLFLIVVSLAFSLQLSSQEFAEGYDSIPITKPNKNKSLYKFDNSIINEIFIKTKRTKRSKYPASQVFGDIGRNTLSVLFGSIMDFEDSDIVTWKHRGKLICNDENYNWDINLFCDGESVKLSESVKNDDGSRSINTYEDKYFNWENEATGIIIEKKDTVGKFFIVMNPQNDSILKQRAIDIFSKSDQLYYEKKKGIKEKWLQLQITDSFIDYGIIGKFRGKNFAIIADGINRKVWLFEKEKLRCVFQADMDDLFISTEDKVKPYLLLDSSLYDEERLDLLRLAILSKYVSKTLSK